MKKNSLVHDLEALQNPVGVPFCSDNHHLDGQHESVSQAIFEITPLSKLQSKGLAVTEMPTSLQA